MEPITVSTEVLEWAAGQVGESLASLSTSIAKRDKDRQAIRLGRLTPGQLERVAKKTRVPFGYLFLDAPPQALHPAIPDLRQAVDAAPLSADFFEVLEDARRKQQWFRDYLLTQGVQPLSFVGRHRGAKPSAKVLAGDVVKTLRISGEERRESSTQEDYFRVLAKRAEDAGILVLKSGIVRSSTKRPLSPREFRGFALMDPLAPLVFINGRDWQIALVFTLIHEICHLFLGMSGVSDLSSAAVGDSAESLCNAAAAEVLVPEAEFLTQFATSPDLQALAKRFRVSRLVIARRALGLKKISLSDYREVAAASANAKPPKNEDSSGNPYATIPVRNSKRLTAALVNSAATGRTLFREAAGLLSVKPDTVAELAARMRDDG